MLPHRSDTSRGHLHPRRVATPRPFPSRRPFFPDLPFLSISRPISSIQRGCFSPVRPLMPPLSREGRGRLRASHPSSPRKRPFFPKYQPILPPQFSTLLSLPPFFLFFPPSSPSFVLRRPMQPWPLCPRVKSRDYSGIRSRKSYFCKEYDGNLLIFSSFLLILIPP